MRTRLFLTLFICFIAVLNGAGQCGPIRAADSIQFSVNSGGAVNATAVKGNTLYLGGNFLEIGHYTGSFTRLDTGTYKVADAATWPKTNGFVQIAIPDNAGGWIIGGQFTLVGDSTRNNLAQIDASGHVTSFRADADDQVYALAITGNSVYVGGGFLHIGGSARNHAAKINLSTSSVSSWNPNTDGVVMTFSLYNNKLYAGGYFANIGSHARNGAAVLDTLTGNALAWNPNVTGNIATISFDAAGYAYIGGSFSHVGGISRNSLAKVDTATGALSAWDAGIGGSLIEQINVMGPTIYVCGTFSTVGSASRTCFAEIDTAVTAGVSSLDPMAGSTTAGLTSFARVGNKLFLGNYDATFPSFNTLACYNFSSSALSYVDDFDNNGISTFTVSGGVLYMGGGFSMMNCKWRHNGAAIDMTADTVTEWDPMADNQINCITAGPDKIYIGGTFDFFDPWIPNNTLYLAATDPVTGVRDTVFLPQIEPAVGVTSMLYDAGSLYAAGIFTGVAGYSREYLAKFSATTGDLDLAWHPTGGFTISVDALEKEGDNIIIGGNFTGLGSATRFNLGSVNKTTGIPTSWDPTTTGIVYALSVSGGKLFVGGSFDSVEHVYSPNLARIDLATGTVDPWLPDPSGAVSVITSYYNMRFIAGYFDHIGTTPAGGLGSPNATAGGWNPSPDYNSVKSMAVYGNRLYVGGSFNTINGGNTFPKLSLYTIPNIPDTISIAGPPAICAGSVALFTAATGIAGGTYNWHVNGADAGVHTTAFSYTPAAGDMIRCTFYPPAGGCYTTDSVVSDPVATIISPVTVPVITITAASFTDVGNIVTVNAAVSSAGAGYQVNWYINGVLSGTTTTPVFTYTKGVGVDSVTAVVSSTAPGCFDTTTSAAIHIGTEGVENVAANGIAVYPNPAHDFVAITGLSSGDVINVYDFSGKKIAVAESSNSPSGCTLSLKSLSPGTWLMIIRSQDGSIKARLPVQKL